MYHNPVLLNECIEGMAIRPNGIYVDVTFGGGGHSREILRKLKDGKLIAFDQDADALENTFDDERFLLINSNFRYLKNFLQLHGDIPVDGIHYVCVGSAGAPWKFPEAVTGYKTYWTPFGYTMVDVKKDKLTVSFIQSDDPDPQGTVLHSFDIPK